MNFDFEKEMVFGKKHIQKLDFDKEKYSFITYLTELFGVTDLSELHKIKMKDYEEVIINISTISSIKKL